MSGNDLIKFCDQTLQISAIVKCVLVSLSGKPRMIAKELH